MYDPDRILSWLVENVQQMRHSRCKTLAAIVSAALQMKRVICIPLCVRRSSRITRHRPLLQDEHPQRPCHVSGTHRQLLHST